MTERTKQWIHMVGIGGAGMSGIARVLTEQGYRVSGSDLQSSSTTTALEALGIRVFIGHSPSNLREDVNLVVVSSAIPATNSELALAKERNVPVLKRGEMLARLVNQRKGIAVAGAHGKTTTTSMLYTLFTGSGVDPTFIVGGEIQESHLGAKLGSSPYAIVEADESDASFLELQPFIAVVTNIEDDHLDYYQSLDNIREAFKRYIDRVQAQGFAVVYGEDESIGRIINQTGTRVITYGESEHNDYYLRNWVPQGMGSQFQVFRAGKYLGDIELSVPGKHNALDALASLAVALEIGMDFANLRHAIKTFKGAKRRFQIMGKNAHCQIVDDYAHHPTEMEATIRAARDYWPQGRLVVVFQPHRYTRTNLMGEQLGAVLAAADLVIVTDVYSAGENPIPGISGEIVHEAACRQGADSHYIPDFDDIESFLLDSVRNGDLIITMGAGDVWKLGVRLAQKLS